MAARGGAGTAQRPNGIPREKVCQFKLVLLGKKTSERARVYPCYVCEVVACTFLSSGCMYVHYSSYQRKHRFEGLSLLCSGPLDSSPVSTIVAALQSVV